MTTYEKAGGAVMGGSLDNNDRLPNGYNPFVEPEPRFGVYDMTQVAGAAGEDGPSWWRLPRFWTKAVATALLGLGVEVVARLMGVR